MSDRPVKVIFDVSTGTQTTVPFTDEEFAEFQELAKQAEEAKAAEEAAFAEREALKASAKAKLIAGEALTPEEADVVVL